MFIFEIEVVVFFFFSKVKNCIYNSHGTAQQQQHWSCAWLLFPAVSRLSSDYINNNTATPGNFSAAQHYANPSILRPCSILSPTPPYLALFLRVFPIVLLSSSTLAYFSHFLLSSLIFLSSSEVSSCCVQLLLNPCKSLHRMNHNA